jgi:hypothetical protein
MDSLGKSVWFSTWALSGRRALSRVNIIAEARLVERASFNRADLQHHVRMNESPRLLGYQWKSALEKLQGQLKGADGHMNTPTDSSSALPDISCHILKGRSTS